MEHSDVGVTLNAYTVSYTHLRRDKCELVDEDDFKDFDQVEVINQFFDLTPASDITGIVTEFGVLHPSQMLQYWSKLWDNIKEGE